MFRVEGTTIHMYPKIPGAIIETQMFLQSVVFLFFEKYMIFGMLILNVSLSVRQPVARVQCSGQRKSRTRVLLP